MSIVTIRSKGGGRLILRGSRQISGGGSVPVFSDCPEACCNHGRIEAVVEAGTCVRLPEDCSVFPRTIEGMFVWTNPNTHETFSERVVLKYDSCEPNNPNIPFPIFTARYVGKSLTWCESGVKCGFIPTLSTPQSCETMEVPFPKLESDGPTVGKNTIKNACFLVLFDYLVRRNSDLAARFARIINSFVEDTPYPDNPWDIYNHVPRSYWDRIVSLFDAFFFGDDTFWGAYVSFLYSERDYYGFFDELKNGLTSEEFDEKIQEAVEWLADPKQLTYMCAFLMRRKFNNLQNVLASDFQGPFTFYDQPQAGITETLKFYKKVEELRTKEVCNGNVQPDSSSSSSSSSSSGSEESGWPFTWDYHHDTGSLVVRDDCGVVAEFGFTENYGDTVNFPVHINSNMAACCNYDAELVFAAIFENQHPDLHPQITCHHGDVPNCLWNDEEITGSFPNYNIGATCCCRRPHTPTLEFVDDKGVVWDGATVTLSNGVLEVTPKIPITVTIQVKDGSGKPIVAGENEDEPCSNLPETLSATANGVSITLRLSGSEYSGTGFIDCTSGTPNVTVSAGGYGVWWNDPYVDSVTCDRYHGWTAVGTVVPQNRHFNLELFFDCGDSEICTDYSASSMPRLRIYPRSMSSQELHENEVYEGTVCGTDPTIAIDGTPASDYWSWKADLLNKEDQPYVMLETTADEDGLHEPSDVVWDPSTETLTIVWKAVCDPTEFGTIRVKLNGAEASSGDGRVDNGYYILVARAGDPISEPTYSFPDGTCLTMAYRGGASFPSTMPAGSTDLELEWTASVSITVDSNNASWPIGSNTCPATPSSHPACENYLSYNPSEASFFTQVKNRSISGNVGGTAVSFTFDSTTESWTFSGTITIRDVSAGVPWRFNGGSYGTAGDNWENWAASANYKSFNDACPGGRGLVWLCKYGAETATIATVSGTLTCQSRTLVGSGTADVELSANKTVTQYF